MSRVLPDGRSANVCWTYKMMNGQNRDADSMDGRRKRLTQYRGRDHPKFAGLNRQKIKYKPSTNRLNAINCSLYFVVHFRNV